MRTWDINNFLETIGAHENKRREAIESGKIYEIDGYGNNLLHVLASSERRTKVLDSNLANILIENGVYVNARNFVDKTPLHLAVNNHTYATLFPSDNVRFVSLLISSGAHLNATDCYDKTPLHCAALGKIPLLCDILLKSGAYPEMIDIYGKTPEQCALREKKKKNLVVFSFYRKEKEEKNRYT